MKFIVFLGMPGTGKGTQCKLLNERDGILSLSPGEIIRNKLSKDKEILEAVNRGELLSDDFIMNLVVENLKDIAKKNNDKILIFDGIPRTVGQANMLNELLSMHLNSSLSLIVYFTVKKRLIINRLKNRVICESCNATNQFSRNFICSVCGSKDFKRRLDDDVKVIRRRLINNKKNTNEIYDFYRLNKFRCIKLKADSNINSIYKKLKEIVFSKKI
jgi:adenylate kinase